MAYYEGDLRQAFTLVGEGVALFRGLKDDVSLAELLVTQGHILKAQGDAKAAYMALTEALQLAMAVDPRLFVAASIEGLASLLAEHGQGDLTVRLLAAAAALRLEMGTPVRPADQTTVDQALATARSMIGPDAFAAV